MAAIAGHGTERVPQGPLVLPGKYEVKLTINGNSYAQTLVVEMDPRIHISKAELKDQLSLAIKVWNAMADQYALSVTVDSLHSQLVALQRRTELDTLMRSAMQPVAAKIESLAKVLNGGDLSGLETTIMGADREPTQQMQDAFDLLDTRLSESKKQFQELTLGDLVSLNKSLKALGIAGVTFSTPPPQHLAR